MLVYPSSGDIINTATKEIVAGLTDEGGRKVDRQKQVDGKPARTVDPFGVGQARTH